MSDTKKTEELKLSDELQEAKGEGVAELMRTMLRGLARIRRAKGCGGRPSASSARCAT